MNEILSGAKENKIGRPRQYHFDRPANLAERKQQQREREKLKEKEEED